MSDCVVTTWPGGAEAFSLADWSPLAGRKVIIWPDADWAGFNAAAQIGRIVQKLNRAETRVTGGAVA